MIKRKSFLKNLLVFAICEAIVLVLNLPFGIDALIQSLTFGAFYSVLVMLVGDALYKLLEAREELTWEYWVAAGLTVLADGFFLTASMTTEVGPMWTWLGITLAAAATCAVMWKFGYQRSTRTPEEVLNDWWEILQKKLKTGFTQAEVQELLKEHLRYRLVGDTLDGALDLSTPLAEVEGYLYSYDELNAEYKKHGTDSLLTILTDTEDYLKKLSLTVED